MAKKSRLKSLANKLSGAHTLEDELLYQIASAEVSEGHLMQGLWTKSLAENEMDEKKASAYYIRERVKQWRPYLKDLTRLAGLLETYSAYERALARYEKDRRQLERLADDNDERIALEEENSWELLESKGIARAILITFGAMFLGLSLGYLAYSLMYKFQGILLVSLFFTVLILLAAFKQPKKGATYLKQTSSVDYTNEYRLKLAEFVQSKPEEPIVEKLEIATLREKLSELGVSVQYDHIRRLIYGR